MCPLGCCNDEKSADDKYQFFFKFWSIKNNNLPSFFLKDARNKNVLNMQRILILCSI